MDAQHHHHDDGDVIGKNGCQTFGIKSQFSDNRINEKKTLVHCYHQVATIQASTMCKAAHSALPHAFFYLRLMPLYRRKETVHDDCALKFVIFMKNKDLELALVRDASIEIYQRFKIICSSSSHVSHIRVLPVSMNRLVWSFSLFFCLSLSSSSRKTHGGRILLVATHYAWRTNDNELYKQHTPQLLQKAN